MKNHGMKSATLAMLALSAAALRGCEAHAEMAKAMEQPITRRKIDLNPPNEYRRKKPIRVRLEGRKLTKAEKKAAKKQQTFKRLVMEFGD